MSLYYDAASLIETSHNTQDSLKLVVFSSTQKLRSPANQLYALLIEAHKWRSVLKEVIEHSEILKLERKLTPALAVVLTHDLLLSKKGLAAPATHPLRKTIEKHRVRLKAELTRLRVKRGYENLDTLRASLQSSSNSRIGSGGDRILARPRWVRINTLKTSLAEQLSTTFRDFRQVDSLQPVLEAASNEPPSGLIHLDKHIPNLVAIPAATDIVTWTEYREGKLVLQDKASCFPAYLLDPQPEDRIIDACAAPGNKTTHLCALVGRAGSRSAVRVWACERDKSRADLLQQMLKTAGADKLVSVRAGQDFLKIDPAVSSGPNAAFSQATGLLLDPSCSGSGMVDRYSAVEWELPDVATKPGSIKAHKKRKREQESAIADNIPAENELVVADDDSALRSRLRSLAAFQLKLLLHAFTFPMARRITYSTCSIHEEENEQVVLAALASPIARGHGWGILPRTQQIDGMRKWHLRGTKVATDDSNNAVEVADACIRCSKSTVDGTQGFFVASFQRKISDEPNDNRDGIATGFGRPDSDGESEWTGFSDGSE